MGAADVRLLPHRVLAPAQLKPVGVRGGMFATAPVVAVGAPSAIHRMTTTEIIARARTAKAATKVIWLVPVGRGRDVGWDFLRKPLRRLRWAGI